MTAMLAHPPEAVSGSPPRLRADLTTRVAGGIYGVGGALALAVGAPVIALRALRDIREMRERLGSWDLPPNLPTGSLWVHAASLGELRGALPLLQALKTGGPPVILSVVTPAARSQAGEAAASGARLIRFAPLDFQPLAGRLLRRLAPSALLICETEIWPGLISAALTQRTPVAFVSARLTERGVSRLTLLKPWLRRLLPATCVAAQSELDAARWRALGAPAPQVAVTGNTKYERPRGYLAPEQRRAARSPWRHLIVFGSVRGSETGAIAQALRACADLPGPALCIVAPRHPGRAEGMRRAFEGCLPRICDRYDRDGPLLPEAGGGETTLLFVHTTGELRRFFEVADLAFVGATLVPLGGHSLFEVAELGVPVLYGPHTASVTDVVTALEAEGGGRRVADGAQLGAAILELLQAPGGLTAASRGAYRAAERLGGAVGRTLHALRRWGFPVPPPNETGG